jgi:aspartokinase/homoserine dehydrogenase 1
VLANKHAGAGPLARWRGLESRAVGRSCALRDGTTVGAALPVLESVRALVARGDRVRALDAVLSGSLAFVLARVHEGAPFSAAVAEAVTLGLAEPDPAEDLGGADVARKLVIVLRAAGEGIERGQVRLAPLADAGDLADPVRRARLDRRWRRRVAAARARGERWVYTARWDGSTARVGAERRPLADPLARLRAGENAVVVWSRHYAQVPLTVAGPGAGPEVTAAGLVTDLLAALRPAAAVRDPVPPGVTAESA